MTQKYTLLEDGLGYMLRGSGTRWRLERWKHTRGEWRMTSTHALDYDARHRRLFLSEADERKMGTAGIAALEKLTRRALGSRG